MSVVGVDLGGTKLALAVFSQEGEILRREVVPLGERQGGEVGELLAAGLRHLLVEARTPIRAVGVAVPGIYHADRGTVWAPNIPGWEDYPLLEELRASVSAEVRVAIDSDRACYILGETWQGAARGSRNAIFLAVGTGIGAGILVEGRVLRGHRDIAGAAGWLALDRPYRREYAAMGCFEYHAAGPGIVRVASDLLESFPDDAGVLREKGREGITTAEVFAAHAAGDPLAEQVIRNAVELWGIAVANLVSLFDPEIVVFGGGVFGPAARFLDRIQEEALRWAQPISMPQVRLAVSSLGADAGLYGAGQLALRALTDHP